MRVESRYILQYSEERTVNGTHRQNSQCPIICNSADQLSQSTARYPIGERSTRDAEKKPGGGGMGPGLQLAVQSRQFLMQPLERTFIFCFEISQRLLSVVVRQVLVDQVTLLRQIGLCALDRGAE